VDAALDRPVNRFFILVKLYLAVFSFCGIVVGNMDLLISFTGVPLWVTITFLIITAVIAWKYCIEAYVDEAIVYMQIELLKQPDEDCDPVRLYKSIVRKSRYWGWDLNRHFEIKGREEELRALVLKCIKLHPDDKAASMRTRITGHRLWEPDDDISFC